MTSSRRAEIREYLRGYLDRAGKTEEIARRITYLESEAYSVKSIDTTAERVQSSPRTHDRIGEIIGKIDAEAQELMEQLTEERNAQAEVVKTIYKIKNKRARSVIFNRFIDGFTWEKTAEVQGHSLRWTHVLEEQGLDELDKIIPKKMLRNVHSSSIVVGL